MPLERIRPPAVPSSTTTPTVPPELTPADIVVEAKSGRVRQAGAGSAEGDTMMALKAQCQRDLFTFAKFILKRKRLTPNFHGSLCRRIQRVPPRRKQYLIPMGTYKTTIISQSLPIHIHIQDADTNPYWPGLDGADMRIMLGCEAQELASSRMRWVQQQWEDNTLLRAFWPHRCWERATLAPKWNEVETIIPRTTDSPEPSIHARGVGGAFVGYHYHVLILDDIIALAAANSPTLMQTAKDWLRTALTRLSPDEDQGLVYMIGTRWAPGDLYEENEDDPTFECETYSIIQDGKPLVPEIYPMEKIERLQKQDGVMFWLWRMNSTANPELVDFDITQVRKYQLQDGVILFSENDHDIDLAKEPPQAPDPLLQPGQRMTLDAWNAYIEGSRDDFFLHNRPRVI